MLSPFYNIQPIEKQNRTLHLLSECSGNVCLVRITGLEPA